MEIPINNKMNVIKKCPSCGSSRITGSVSIEDGRYIQKIGCKKCGYQNHRDIGSAEKTNY
jgi:transposase-like protein